MLANAFSFLPTSYVRDHMSFADDVDGDPDRAACLAVGVALDVLIDRLGLKATLSEYKVPEEDLEKLAKGTFESISQKPGWKGICPTADQLLNDVLKAAY